MLQKYMIPYNFAPFAKRWSRYFGWASILCFGFGIWLSATAPPDYQQGKAVLMMFVHVPAAWMALFTYSLMAFCSLIVIISRLPIADIAARNLAPIGICFTFLALTTGSIWGKPMWGVWWVWDSRLTSVFILLLLYLGYIALRQAVENEATASRLAAILALVGAIDIPIIKFSVDWWHSLHQPSSVSLFSPPAIHISLLLPLIVMACAYMLLMACLTLRSMHTDISRIKLHALERRK